MNEDRLVDIETKIAFQENTIKGPVPLKSFISGPDGMRCAKSSLNGIPCTAQNATGEGHVKRTFFPGRC